MFEHLKNYSARSENETGHRIITLRGDNEDEYTSNELEAWLKEKSIRHETRVAKTHQKNGASERTNRTILESARSMLHLSSLGVELRAKAAAWSVYLLKRILTIAKTDSTPYFGWYCRKSNVSHLRIFGFTAYRSQRTSGPNLIRNDLSASSWATLKLKKDFVYMNPYQGR